MDGASSLSPKGERPATSSTREREAIDQHLKLWRRWFSWKQTYGRKSGWGSSTETFMRFILLKLYIFSTIFIKALSDWIHLDFINLKRAVTWIDIWRQARTCFASLFMEFVSTAWVSTVEKWSCSVRRFCTSTNFLKPLNNSLGNIKFVFYYSWQAYKHG